MAKNFRLIATTFYGYGGGRYLVGLGPDLVIGPDGSISPVHSMAGIAGFEYAPNPKSQFFAYYGGTYFDKNYTVVSPGNYLGFGFPGSSSANRQFQETDVRLLLHLLEGPEVRRAAGYYAVFLPDARALVRCARNSIHGARPHDFRLAAFHAAVRWGEGAGAGEVRGFGRRLTWAGRDTVQPQM